jgi:hypothetical protein
MDEKLRLLWKANGYMDAELLKGYLNSYGIEVISYGESVGQAYGLTTTPLGQVELFVREDRFVEAQNILNDFYSLPPGDKT